MAEGIELAKAYVQVIPSAKGIKGQLASVMEPEAESAGESAGQLLGSRMVGVLTKVISTAAIGKAISSSITQGAALEQSIGGIETLFKDSAEQVKQAAAQAYKTAGLSANAYMEQATSFAASLLASLGNDTQAAARVADTAMQDMADNSNKMGTAMDSIQMAYQGFAKQNYTMLDNLKLGYGGTKAEMERLLADAQELTGVQYDISSLADVYNAIHAIQEELGITGTTAKEAESTITGSLNAMKAAAQNVLGQLALGEDLTPSLEALVETAETFLLGNFLPAVANVVSGIPQIIAGIVPAALEAGAELMGSISSGFAAGIPEFFSTALPQLLAFTDELRANFSSFVSAGIDLILSLAQGILDGLPQLFAYIPDIVINIAGLINDNAPKLLAGGVQLVVMLGKGVLQSIPLILQNFGKIVEAALSVISAVNWVNLGGNLIKGISDGIKSMAGNLANAFKEAFTAPLDWLASLPSKMLQAGKNILQSFTNGLSGKSGATVAVSLYEGLSSANYYASRSSASIDDDPSIVDKAEVNAWLTENRLKDLQQTAGQTTATVSKALSGTTTAAQNAAAATQKTAATVVKSITDTATQTLDGVTRTVKTVTETLSDGTEQQKQVITDTATQTIDGARKTVETITTIAADGTRTVAQTIQDAATTELEDLWTAIDGKLESGVLGSLDTLWSAIQSGDWWSVGKWAASALYAGLADDQKQQLAAFALNMVTQLSDVLDGARDSLAQHAWSIGASIVEGITNGFPEILAQASSLGSALTQAFASLSGPLSAAANAISAGLSGGLLSSFPTIFAGFAGMIGTVGAAVEAMLAAVSAALSATVFGIPAGLVVAAAGVALAAAIAAIIAKLGGSHVSSTPSTPSSPGTPSSGGGTSSSPGVISGTSFDLWEMEKTSSPERRPKPNVEVNQYIYSKAQTAADLMREAQHEQERAVLQGV